MATKEGHLQRLNSEHTSSFVFTNILNNDASGDTVLFGAETKYIKILGFKLYRQQHNTLTMGGLDKKYKTHAISKAWWKCLTLHAALCLRGFNKTQHAFSFRGTKQVKTNE